MTKTGGNFLWIGKSKIAGFQKLVWKAYSENRRDSLPWRKTKDPYKILVSEVMLQQTQVDRVIPKYEAFIKKFSNVNQLAKAPQSEVLSMWQGLGYNRRALFLKKTAEAVVKEFNGKFPKSVDELIKLPGIGQSTAGAISNFAFAAPAVFIETNIRAVYLHHFFSGISDVSDIDIKTIIDKTLDRSNPREWFYALYDYGTVLKKQLGSKKTLVHKQSKHYNKQSTFKGSNREVRGQILKVLIEAKEHKGINIEKLKKGSTILAKTNDAIILENLQKLQKEGFVQISENKQKFAIL